MKNCEFIIEQYRGDKLVRSFTPTGNEAWPWSMNVSGKKLPEDEWLGLVQDIADLGRGFAVQDEGHGGSTTDFWKWLREWQLNSA